MAAPRARTLVRSVLVVLGVALRAALPVALFIALWVAGGAGCGAPTATGADLSAAAPDLAPSVCSEGELGDAGPPPTFARVEVVLDRSCGTTTCHFPGFEAVDLTHGHAWANLVGQLAPDAANRCGGPLVTPGDVARSYLYVKLTRGLGMQCNPNGNLMPLGDPFSIPLPDCEIDLFRRWIEAGAPP